MTSADKTAEKDALPDDHQEDQEPEIQRLSDDETFKHDVNRILNHAEDMRIDFMKRYRNRGFIAMAFGLIAICAGTGGFGWYLIMHGDIQKAVSSIALAIIFPVILFLWHDNPIKSYKQSFKRIVMPEIANVLGGLKFSSNRGVNAKIISKTGIVPRFDTYHSEDCFLGRYKNMKVIFSEARLYENPHTDPVFHGVFVLLETSQKTFKGHTIITADENMVRNWAKRRWKKLSPVHLPDDSEYKSDFHGFSDHPEEAKPILTTGLLKELSETCEVFENTPISAAFFRGKYIFLAIPCARNMFEPSNIYVPISTKEHAITCKREIDQILEIIDIFDLYQT